MLSEMYEIADDDPNLELKVNVLNINTGHNPTILTSCKTLADYSEYTNRVRKYAKEMSTKKAVERAITECIDEGILSEFLRKYRTEAMHVSIYEYDEIEQLRMEREEGRAEGREEGRAEGKAEGIEKGKLLILMEMISKKTISFHEAAVIAGMTEKEFEEKTAICNQD